MASGCAIIASDVGAVSEQVSSGNGWLIRPGSVDDLIDSMREAISATADQLVAKKNRSFELLREKFLWDEVALKTIDSFEQILTINK
jgi:glycosyltransferase involved in cell wall biosynthesis